MLSAELNTRIHTFITDYNDRCHFFVWTWNSTEIFIKAS